MRTTPDSLDRAIEHTTAAARQWWTRAHASSPWLLAVPDVAATCEVLLADRLFHDLHADERDGLLSWLRAEQDESGAWLDLDGNPDLSITALAWWARAQAGDDTRAQDMVKALRVVHELGGAQRASFNVRIWLAMAGLVPWDWLPSIPSELWLLPSYVALSPGRISTWARGVLTPYHVLASAPARLQLADASALLLRAKDGTVIPPRLMRPGLAGDLLQAFDRAIKVSRKLPRGPIKRVAFERARTWIDEAQQDHGGWFSVRPTLLSLLALRVRGARSDDPRLRRGLDHLRRARGVVAGGERALAQGLSSLPVGIAAGLARAAGVDATAWLVAAEIGGSGPWQGRANAPAGGWPDEVGANSHLDLHTTCAVLDALHAGVGEHERGSESASAWPSVRRATDVILAMQEPDGSFARFERGESDVLLARFPWRDADQLAAGATDDVARVELTAMALRQLAALGRRSEDDRVERGLQWLAVQAGRHARAWSVPTLAAVGRCAAAHCPPGHDLRRGVEVRIRSRQREDGGFGGTVDTACALLAMLDLDGACVQATRAARDLVRAVEDAEDATSLGTGRAPGLGLSPQLRDVSAGVRHVNFALTRFRHAGGRL